MKKSKQSLFFAAAALASVLALSACGSGNDDNSASSASASASAPAASASAPSASPSASAPTASAPAAGGETKEITVTATNFSFDQTEIHAKVGDTLKLTLQNKDGVHGLEIPDLNVNLKNGDTATIVLDKAGTYDFNCSVMCGTGHDNMTGQLIVE